MSDATVPKLTWSRVKLPGIDVHNYSLYRSGDGRFEIERQGKIWVLVDTSTHRHHPDYSTAVGTLKEGKRRAQERVGQEPAIGEVPLERLNQRQPRKDDVMFPLDCGVRRIVEIRDGNAMDLDGALGGIGGSIVSVDRLVYNGGNSWREVER